MEDVKFEELVEGLRKIMKEEVKRFDEKYSSFNEKKKCGRRFYGEERLSERYRVEDNMEKHHRWFYDERSEKKVDVKIEVEKEIIQVDMEMEEKNIEVEVDHESREEIKTDMHDFCDEFVHDNCDEFMGNIVEEQSTILVRVNSKEMLDEPLESQNDFGEQLEQLVGIHKRFKLDFDQHLQGYDHLIEDLEELGTEFEGNVKRHEASNKKFLSQAEEAVNVQLDVAERKILAAQELAKEKLLQLKLVVAERKTWGFCRNFVAEKIFLAWSD